MKIGLGFMIQCSCKYIYPNDSEVMMISVGIKEIVAMQQPFNYYGCFVKLSIVDSSLWQPLWPP